MNKYKTQETFCYSLISSWVIGIIIIMLTSCNSYKETVKVDNNGIYHQPHQYEAWSNK